MYNKLNIILKMVNDLSSINSKIHTSPNDTTFDFHSSINNWYATSKGSLFDRQTWRRYWVYDLEEKKCEKRKRRRRRRGGFWSRCCPCCSPCCCLLTGILLALLLGGLAALIGILITTTTRKSTTSTSEKDFVLFHILFLIYYFFHEQRQQRQAVQVRTSLFDYNKSIFTCFLSRHNNNLGNDNNIN